MGPPTNNQGQKGQHSLKKYRVHPMAIRNRHIRPQPLPESQLINIPHPRQQPRASPRAPNRITILIHRPRPQRRNPQLQRQAHLPKSPPSTPPKNLVHKHLAHRAALHDLDDLVVLERRRRVHGQDLEQHEAVLGKVLRRLREAESGRVEGADAWHFAAHVVGRVWLELAFDVRVDAWVGLGRVGGAVARAPCDSWGHGD